MISTFTNGNTNILKYVFFHFPPPLLGSFLLHSGWRPCWTSSRPSRGSDSGQVATLETRNLSHLHLRSICTNLSSVCLWTVGGSRLYLEKNSHRGSANRQTSQKVGVGMRNNLTKWLASAATRGVRTLVSLGSVSSRPLILSGAYFKTSPLLRAKRVATQIERRNFKTLILPILRAIDSQIVSPPS